MRVCGLPNKAKSYIFTSNLHHLVQKNCIRNGRNGQPLIGIAHFQIKENNMI